MRVPWRRLTWLLVAVVPIAAIVGLVWISTRDLSRYQARLTEQIRKVTGRELATKVPLSVKLGREPAMVAEGVTLSNAPWGSRPELARVRKLTVFIDPIAIFLGEIKIGRVLIEGADILVETNNVGDTNIDMLPPPDGSGPHAGENRSLKLRSGPIFPWIGTVEVRDSTVTISEGAGRPSVVVEVPSATFRASAPNQPLQVEGRFGVPRATPLELTGSAGSFDGWMRSLPGNIDLQGSLGGGKIAIKGGVGVKGTTVQVNAEGPDVSVFGPYIRLPVPAGGPYVLAVKAATQRNSFKVDVTTLKVGASELTADALFRVDRKGTPTVAINADVTRLDLGGLKAAPAEALSATATAPPQQPRLVPSMPFSATWLGRSALSANVQFGEVVGLGSKVQSGSIALNASETRFAFRAAATIGGGSAALDLAYDPAGRFGQTTLTGSANRVPLADLSSLLGLNLGLRDGMADIDLRLRGSGRTTRDALNSSSGSFDIGVTKGSWPRDQLANWPAETHRLLAGSDAIPFNCIAGRFDVTGGVAFLRRLVIDTPRATMVGGGYVQLRSEAWEFMLAPEARDQQNAALASPLRLKGGSGRDTASSLDPNLARLIVPAGTVPSLVAQIAQASRQTGVNPCTAVAPRVEALRPGLRAQLPVPAVEQRRPGRPSTTHNQKPQRGRQR